MAEFITLLDSENMNLVDGVSIKTVYCEKSQSDPDDIAIYYTYTKGDEDGIILSFGTQMDNIDGLTYFEVADVDGNTSKTLTASGTGRILFKMNNFDNNFVVKVSVSGVTAPTGSGKIGFKQVSI